MSYINKYLRHRTSCPEVVTNECCQQELRTDFLITGFLTENIYIASDMSTDQENMYKVQCRSVYIFTQSVIVQDKVFVFNKKELIFSCFSMNMYVLVLIRSASLRKCLTEVLLMSTHKICFCREINYLSV